MACSGGGRPATMIGHFLQGPRLSGAGYPLGRSQSRGTGVQGKGIPSSLGVDPHPSTCGRAAVGGGGQKPLGEFGVVWAMGL